jgi:acyl-CoA thioesterase
MHETLIIAAQHRAERRAAQMLASDAATTGLGMVLQAIAPGAATLRLTVTGAMVNGHGTCHGGFIFALADSAFAFACNSHGDDAVAAHCTITYLAPARIGDVLEARATELERFGRNGIYDVVVTANAPGGARRIAQFRGHSRVIGAAQAEAQAEDQSGAGGARA